MTNKTIVALLISGLPAPIIDSGCSLRLGPGLCARCAPLQLTLVTWPSQVSSLMTTLLDLLPAMVDVQEANAPQATVVGWTPIR